MIVISNGGSGSGVSVRPRGKRTVRPSWQRNDCQWRLRPIMLSVRLCRGSSALFGGNQAGSGFPAVQAMLFST